MNLHDEAVRLAIHRFLGDGRWHTMSDLWFRLKQDDNPADSFGSMAVVLERMKVSGAIEKRRVFVPEYRLVPHVDD